MKHKHLLILLAAILLTSVLAFAQEASLKPTVTTAQQDAHMAWWREAKFGMFIHWGLYAIPARGEWVMNKEKIPVAKYAELAKQFNPVKFNAEQWVKVAKDAGMKYIVITSKHHDGFAMFGSKVSSYNIVDATPFKRDPMKELAAACAKEGIKLGFYYSEAQDWHQPGGGVSGGSWDPAQKGDFDHYLHTLAIPQVKELLSGYSPAVLWFDTPVNMTPAYALEIAQVVRSIQPETIINSRLLYSGRAVENLDTAKLDELRDIGVDYLSYRDRGIPEHPAWRDWETCMTLNNSWGYTENDSKWKSPEVLIQQLVEVASKSGNFLLNVGPTAEGEIPAPSVRNLKAVGQWLKTNGEAIYGTGPGVFPNLTWGRCTSRPGKLYLHVFNWPTDGQLDVPAKLDVKKATLLAEPDQSLIARVAGLHTIIKLPATAPDQTDSVLCVEINGAPELDPSVKAPAEPTPANAGKKGKKK